MGERCCTGRPEGGMAFRRVRPPIALAIASRQPMTGAPNECRLQGGTRKYLSPSAMRSEPMGRIGGTAVISRCRQSHAPSSLKRAFSGGV